MKTASLIKIAGGLLLVSALSINVAKANSLVTGDINFTSSPGGVTVNTGSLATATTITSVSATVQAGSQDGDYSTVPDGTAVSFNTPLNFVALETALPTAVTPWWSFTVGTTVYSFAIDGSITLTAQNSTDIHFIGIGTAAITGETSNTDTSFTVDLSRSGASRISFTNATSAPGVPDSGTTALLIVLGLAGVAMGVLAQRRKLAKV